MSKTSAVDMAIRAGNWDIFCRIYKKMALGNNEISQQHYYTLLDQTAFIAQVAMVKDVLGTDLDGKADGANIACALIEAVTWVDLARALKVLLEKGADPNRRDAARKTALHHLGSPAHSRDRRGPKWCLHETGIRLLLQLGASVTVRDELGNTPLHYAAFGSNLHIFSLYTTALPVNSPHGNALKSIKNDSGETLLHWAAADHGADPLAYIAESWTPLHCLSLYLDDRGSNNELAELATELIARGVPVDARATILAVSTTGREPLRVSNQDVGTWGSRVVEHLQPNNNESLAVIKDRTPLHWAMVHGAVGMANVLVVNGADVNAVDEKNHVPADLVNSSPLLHKDKHLELRIELARI
ncbi:Ankyrin repeat protein [Metarhizium robertsii ARSEF 23]|nr:Ankyrin repeat protein [Metarhizium robertsii ARSEF 23]EFY95136.1 Ankyrin repeat protein [Metarhizium robertsii ARSEF 23]